MSKAKTESKDGKDVISHERTQAPFRVKKELYDKFKKKCEDEARTYNSVLAKLLEMYVNGKVKL
jgi:hypothetical protein